MQEESYRQVSTKDLTINELRASRLPDNSLTSIWVNFTSKSDKHYTAVHVYRHDDGPYILLCGLDKKLCDFKEVERIIVNETNSKPEGSIIGRNEDICSIIHLRHKPTQAMVANFIERYEKYFSNLKIPVAFFHDIPKSAYENSNLSLEKLSFEKVT
ncbi:hypothetical protein HYU07_01335 [Candidatus Woesearchaeota archaeon]|nr:hypothetical protein [Candidatus Woesearchaeota archaeon]